MTTTMKRKALGRGLGSLIPSAPPQGESKPRPGLPQATRGTGQPPGPPKSSAQGAAPQRPQPESVELPRKPAITMSAADILVASGVNVPIETLTTKPQAGHAEQVREIPLDLISSNPDQPRQVISEEQLDELAASIRTNGILQPILVRPWADRYQLVAGERRFRAARKAGL